MIPQKMQSQLLALFNEQDLMLSMFESITELNPVLSDAAPALRRVQSCDRTLGGWAGGDSSHTMTPVE